VAKIKIDKAVPGEEAACDDCQFYKHARDMEGQEFHFCSGPLAAGSGYQKTPTRLKYKMSECDFFSKDKSEFDFDIESENSAWYCVTAPDPRDPDKTMELFLTPGEYYEYTRSFGTVPMSAFTRRGLNRRQNESKTKQKRTRRTKR
jgi:hypothetical protein